MKELYIFWSTGETTIEKVDKTKVDEIITGYFKAFGKQIINIYIK